jgi:hypothetical protein
MDRHPERAMTDPSPHPIPPRPHAGLVVALWVWVIVVLGAYLYQFRSIAGRVIEIMFGTA